MAGKRTPLRIMVEQHLLAELKIGSIPTLQQVAMQFSTNKMLVSRIRRDLARRDLYPLEACKADSRRKGTAIERLATRAVRLVNESAAIPGAGEDFIKKAIFAQGSPMSLDERRIFLADLAKFAVREEVKVTALSALNRLEASLGDSNKTGPSAPLTKEEAYARLNELKRATGFLFP